MNPEPLRRLTPPPPKPIDWLETAKQAAKVVGEVTGAAFTLWCAWILMPPALRITIQAQVWGLVRPFHSARQHRRDVAGLWADVIHLQTFGVDRRKLLPMGEPPC